MAAYDCIVVGSGHAGSCAALSASESGCKKGKSSMSFSGFARPLTRSIPLPPVLLVDKCPIEWVGGNGYFTAGAHRTVHDGLTDLISILHNPPSSEEAGKIDIIPYTCDDFRSDIMRLSKGKSDSALVDAVVNDSRAAIEWLAKVGIPFCLSFNRQAYQVDGRQKFWGGMALSVEGGGKGLIAAHQQALTEAGVTCWFEAPVTSILMEDGAVCGARLAKGGNIMEVKACNVILAAGGFEANAELRARHLGQGWEKAKVTMTSTGLL